MKHNAVKAEVNSFAGKYCPTNTGGMASLPITAPAN